MKRGGKGGRKLDRLDGDWVMMEGLLDAYQKGLERSGSARARKGKHRFGWKPKSQEQRHTDGMSSASEWFVAERTGRRWISDGLVPDRRGGADVEGGISVRWTAQERGSLIVHPDDTAPFSVLVVGNRLAALRIVGWIETESGKDRRFWRTDVRHPAFFVPQAVLKPISLLEKV